MSTYLGHCRSCDVTIEAESLALHMKEYVSTQLTEKYGKEIALEIVTQLKQELNQDLAADWFVAPFPTPDELF